MCRCGQNVPISRQRNDGDNRFGHRPFNRFDLHRPSLSENLGCCHSIAEQNHGRASCRLGSGGGAVPLSGRSLTGRASSTAVKTPREAPDGPYVLLGPLAKPAWATGCSPMNWLVRGFCPRPHAEGSETLAPWTTPGRLPDALSPDNSTPSPSPSLTGHGGGIRARQGSWPAATPAYGGAARP